MSTQVPAHIRATLAVEEASGIDAVVRRVAPLANALVGSPVRRDLLQGRWLGHAVHPVMTMLPVGTWSSAGLLDAVGGRDARRTARTLVGVGVLAAVPTALTGWAEWSDIGRREQRVGVVHAGLNAAGIVLQAMSWRARRRGDQRRGVALSLAGMSLVGVGGYLGGHLTEVRNVSSRHPVFESGPLPPRRRAHSRDEAAEEARARPASTTARAPASRAPASRP